MVLLLIIIGLIVLRLLCSCRFVFGLYNFGIGIMIFIFICCYLSLWSIVVTIIGFLLIGIVPCSQTSTKGMMTSGCVL